MSKISRGKASVVLMDLTDGRQLVFYIHTNLQKQVIFDPDTNMYTPNFSTKNMVLTPQLRLHGETTEQALNAKSISWYVQENSTGEMVPLTTSDTNYVIGAPLKTITIKNNIFSRLQSVTFLCEIVYVDPVTQEEYMGISEVELDKITNGSSAIDPIIATLTNDMHVIQTKADGTGGVFTGAESSMKMYQGAEEITSLYTITTTASTGISGTYTGGVYKLTGMSVDEGVITFKATRPNYPTLTKAFTVTKIRNGEDGNITYIDVSHGVVKKDEDGNYNTDTITAMGMQKVGDRTPELYTGLFKFYISADGVNFGSPAYTSGVGSSATYTIPSNITALKVELYVSSGTQLMDSEIIHIVLDGADAVVPVITTPDGSIVHNKEHSLRTAVTLYKGAAIVTASKYQWYQRDPQGTGDVNSGTGWYVLTDAAPKSTAGYKTDTLTIYPDAILGSETFMCIATYAGRIYKSTITVTDITDPYSFAILGSGTFKNGLGENSYTCKVYQNGEELEGLYYSYIWSMYDSSGSLDPTFSKTGKTITVSAQELTNIGVLECTVDDNK